MSRLPFGVRDLETRPLDLRRDRIPVSYNHPVRDIDDEMESIVYNTIDVIQDRARDNELRTFFYNMMSNRDWKNRDFDELVEMIADVIDISVTEGKFRDVRDAVMAVVEDVVSLAVANQTEEYPVLLDYTDRRQERDLAEAVRLFEKYKEAISVYRRNGNRLPSGRGSRDRDDRDYRGGRGSSANLGSDRGGRDSNRRDRWERGAVRGGVHGEPSRQSQRENRFGGTDQSSRFEDDTRDTRDTGRDNRNERRSSRDDRYEDAVSGSRLTRKENEESVRPARVQHLPGYSRDTDVEDALARENEASNKGSNNMTENEIAVRNQLADTNNPTLTAFENQDAWLPSLKHPHPLVVNHTQELFYELDLAKELVIPRIVNKDSITVDYYAHGSMAFGGVPKDFQRFEDGGVANRLNALHEALVKPTEDFNVDGSDATVTYHNKLDLTEYNFLGYSLKDAMVRVSYRRFIKERQQPNGENFHPVELAVAKSSIIESFITTQEESGLLEELRQISSFTKMAEKLRGLAKKVRPELFLQLDRHFTTAVNHMLRQYLSIPSVKITSFTSDWLELFSWITEHYGEGYRDAINTHQEREIRKLMNADTDSELYVMTQLPEGELEVRPFVVAMPTKIMFVNEVGYNLDIDMVPEVASQILPEANPFFHDLAQELLTIDGDNFGRFFIQTADLRVIEASRSFINEKAILLRMVK